MTLTRAQVPGQHPYLSPVQGTRYRGSIHDHPDFDPGQDAEALYNAMKGIGGCWPRAGRPEGRRGLERLSSAGLGGKGCGGVK